MTEQRADTVEQRVDAVQQRADAVQRRADAVQQRADAVQQRAGAVEQSEDGAEHIADAVEEREETVSQRVEAVAQRVEVISQRTDAVEQRMELAEQRIGALEETERLQLKSPTVIIQQTTRKQWFMQVQLKLSNEFHRKHLHDRDIEINSPLSSCLLRNVSQYFSQDLEFGDKVIVNQADSEIKHSIFTGSSVKFLLHFCGIGVEIPSYYHKPHTTESKKLQHDLREIIGKNVLEKCQYPVVVTFPGWYTESLVVIMSLSKKNGEKWNEQELPNIEEIVRNTAKYIGDNNNIELDSGHLIPGSQVTADNSNSSELTQDSSWDLQFKIRVDTSSQWQSQELDLCDIGKGIELKLKEDGQLYIGVDDATRSGEDMGTVTALQDLSQDKGSAPELLNLQNISAVFLQNSKYENDLNALLVPPDLHGNVSTLAGNLNFSFDEVNYILQKKYPFVYMLDSWIKRVGAEEATLPCLQQNLEEIGRPDAVEIIMKAIEDLKSKEPEHLDMIANRHNQKLKRSESDASLCPYFPTESPVVDFDTSKVEKVSVEKPKRTSIDSDAPTAYVVYVTEDEEHLKAIEILVPKLRKRRINIKTELFESNEYSQNQGYYIYSNLVDAEYVLFICTPSFVIKDEGSSEGRKAAFIEKLVLDFMSENSTYKSKYIPILLPGCQRNDIPIYLREGRAYDMPHKDFYDDLQQRIFKCEQYGLADLRTT